MGKPLSTNTTTGGDRMASHQWRSLRSLLAQRKSRSNQTLKPRSSIECQEKLRPRQRKKPRRCLEMLRRRKRKRRRIKRKKRVMLKKIKRKKRRTVRTKTRRKMTRRRRIRRTRRRRTRRRTRNLPKCHLDPPLYSITTTNSGESSNEIFRKDSKSKMKKSSIIDRYR